MNNAHRDVALAAMRQMTLYSEKNDFMARANIPMPEVIVRGALPAMGREQVAADMLKIFADLVMNFTIGDFDDTTRCSTYYDPQSPWYNVFYGGYALRSYKLDGSAWGYNKDGSPEFDEFLKVPAIDYNFLTAGQFGCPPDKMCFKIEGKGKEWKDGKWDCVDVMATVPSGLHDPTTTLGDPSTYVIYGVPDPTPLHTRQPYEPVAMRGTMYMTRIPQERIPQISQPITLAFGALCGKDGSGEALRTRILDALKEKYCPIADT